ncbi:hypothetical protein HC891_21195 [Candidatus Gracilibacteria bacterium]|nr:hypothetical protein [Candidatus Gracilibacteria bacterium]
MNYVRPATRWCLPAPVPTVRRLLSTMPMACGSRWRTSSPTAIGGSPISLATPTARVTAPSA